MSNIPKWLFLLLSAVFLSISTYGQGLINNNDDDDDDDDDFIILGRPGLKPDTATIHPECIDPHAGRYNFYITVQMANLNQITLPCPLVAEVLIQEAGNPNNQVTIYSDPLWFQCDDPGFCDECPDARLCKANATFSTPSDQFYNFCTDHYEEKLDIDFTVSVRYYCQSGYHSLSELETEGCLGYLPSSCFNVTANGSVDGEGCLVCPRDPGPTRSPEIPGDFEGQDLEQNKGKAQMAHSSFQPDEAPQPIILNNQVKDLLSLRWPDQKLEAPTAISLISPQGQTMKQYKELVNEIDVSQWSKGIYYIVIQHKNKVTTLPWVKL